MKFETYRKPGRIHRRTVAARATSELRRLFQTEFTGDDWAFETRLNGSFANRVMTNNSDIDFLITLTRPMWSAHDHYLIDEGSARRAPPEVEHSWKQFRDRVLRAVERQFGSRAVTDNSKAIQVMSTTLGVPIDIVVTVGFQYSGQAVTSTARVDSGVSLWTSDGTELLHFPFLHRRRGKVKQISTSGCYQRAVRDLKSIRDWLVDRERIPPDSAPGYYIEHLCRSVPDWVYTELDCQSVYSVIAYLQTKSLSEQTIIAGSKPMFGSHELQWSVEDCRRLLREAAGFLQSDEMSLGSSRLTALTGSDR